MTFTATYSPEDNKLRLSASSRLPKELYERVREAGFIWAPRQEIFVAPTWTPEREDLCIELAGEIGDEDTSLVERAEERAERFDDYRESRISDAQAARDAVARIADGIPLGQPILVGHHSEKRARKDAEKIENGMKRAVKMWETAQYWKDRAAGAIAHAKYKELPAVRARRIKGLEADKRKHESDIERSQTFIKLWSKSLEYDPEIRRLTREQARAIANYDRACSSMRFPLKDYPRNPPASQYEGAMGLWSALGDSDAEAIITPEQARDLALRGHARIIAYTSRWLAHVNNRLEYERAMLAEGGGLNADKFNIEVGGQVKRRGEWHIVLKLNKRNGVLGSVTVSGHWAATIPVEDIQDYQPPAEGDDRKVQAAMKQLPLCNFRSEGCIEMTSAEWKEKSKYSDALAVRNFTAEGEYVWRGTAAYRHRSRYYLGNHETGTKVVRVFLTDAKVTNPPTAAPPKPEPIQRIIEAPKARPTYKAPELTEFDLMRDSLRSGVAVVSAPQLFPTPTDLAQRIVQEADIQPLHRVLEPSAGTGNLIAATREVSKSAAITAVEINPTLADGVRKRFDIPTITGDFLEQNGNLGKFDRIIMNPPFENAEDIKHIEHAAQMLKPGGRLVAICANGPRQQDRLKPLAENSGGWYEPLPADTFKMSGTSVNTALVLIEAKSSTDGFDFERL